MLVLIASWSGDFGDAASDSSWELLCTHECILVVSSLIIQIHRQTFQSPIPSFLGRDYDLADFILCVKPGGIGQNGFKLVNGLLNILFYSMHWLAARVIVLI